MSTSKYLDSVLKVMPATQAKQISDLLTSLRAQGEIKNADEYTKMLEELSTLINNEEPIPSFKQLIASVWGLCSSEQHNYMMTAMKNDLQAIYYQIDEIGRTINDHHFLFMKNLIADLERGLLDQENQILRLEWLAGQDNEFSIALVNSFISASLLRVARNDVEAKGLYFDNRTYVDKTEEELSSAVVDEYGDKLILGNVNEPIIYPVSAKRLNDKFSYGTREKVHTQNDIKNIIDGTRGTFWLRDVYLDRPVPKVNTVLYLDLGVAKDVNYISFEGATAEPFVISSLQGVNPDGSITSLIDSEIEASGNFRVDFDRVFIKAFKITFSVSSYEKKEYYVPDSSELSAIIAPEPTYRGSAITKTIPPKLGAIAGLAAKITSNTSSDSASVDAALSKAARDSINSEKFADALNIPYSSEKKKQINSYVYSFGLDNIWAGFNRYQDSGVFVSKPLKSTNIGILAVSKKDNIGTSDIENSIEFEIIKRDNAPYTKEYKFPIPHIGQKEVRSERLLLTKKEVSKDIEDTGKLRFCPYIAPDIDLAEKPIQIYKNGVEIVLGTDYEYAISTISDASGNTVLDWQSANWVPASDFDNYTLDIPKMWIRILRPESTAVYTVNYEIRTSDTYDTDKTLWLDVDKNIFLSDSGRVNFKQDNLDVKIDSNIYLQITLRRNMASQSTSPELLEYAVLGATYS